MNNSFVKRIKLYLELSKLKIMLPVSLTGFTGYFVFDPRLSAGILLIALGILLLSIAATVLNQLQEVELDRKMNRTHDRPIPAGRIKKGDAAMFFLICLIAGTAILGSAGNIKAAIIGLITIVWYNGIYTCLKRLTAFAVVPGAVTGALPPLIGWVAAGGGLWDKPIILIEFLFFIGQIPHFWLLILKYGEEYHNAGIPSLTTILSPRQINRLTFTWIVTSVIAALYLCFFQIISNGLLIGILIIASIFLVWQFSDLLRMSPDTLHRRKYSAILYSYFLLVMILLLLDKIMK